LFWGQNLLYRVGTIQYGKAVLTANKDELLRACKQKLWVHYQIKGDFADVNTVPRAHGTCARLLEMEKHKSTFGVKIADYTRGEVF